ncbi:MAG TPA: hypothetical protein VGR28_10710, partial [Candidatus Thermoplasmatota archaeon]|nr:hypothetical protein [Candidatus Thermoplasmatota archaeon]
MRILAALALGLLMIAPVVALPAAPLGDASPDPLAAFGESPRLAPPLDPVKALNRFVPRAPGTVVDATYVFGPFVIPAGWDLNRVWADVPVHDGFVTKLGYRLVDAATGEAYTNMQVHIHHALWFENQGTETLLDFGEFIYGTGEELTRLDLDARSDAVPGGPRYGLWMPQAGAQTMLMMLHNKEQAERVVEILLDVTFVHGSAAAIAAAAGCDNPAPLPGEGCVAGADVHALDGQLWGAIYNVPRNAAGSGVHVYPSLTGSGIRFTADRDGTLVHAAGHVHTNGLRTVIVNLGSTSEPCGDLDADGFPGITLLRSDKFDRVAAAAPHSEDFQMGVT